MVFFAPVHPRYCSAVGNSQYLHPPDQETIYLTPWFEDARDWALYTQEDTVLTDLTPRELSEVALGETFYLSRVLSDDLAKAGSTFLLLDCQ